VEWTRLPSHQPITLVGFAARKKLCLLYTWVRRLVAESDRAQRTLKLLAGIFREHELGASAATALGGRRSASSAASENYRDCQETMDLAAAVAAKTHDLARRIDAESVEKIQGRLAGNEAIEVVHRPILPEECSQVLPAGIDRDAGHLSLVVDRDGSAYDVPRQRAKVGHPALLPQECVLVHVAWQIRRSDNLIPIVDGEAGIFQFSSETAEVNRPLALPPQQRVARLER